MTTLANNARTYAAVAAMKSTPHIKDQKATGRPKGVTTTGCSTTGVGAIKLTTDRLYQGTTGSPMGVAKVQIMQPQGNAKSMLHKALYKVFNIKEPMIMEQKDPIKVNAICYSGHKHIPPPDKLMRSKECFHCHKKGHYAHNCRIKQ